MAQTKPKIPEPDKDYWRAKVRQPDWYFEYIRLAEAAQAAYAPDSPQLKAFSKQIRHIFEELLENGEVNLAADGPDLDEERLTPDTIVIHHTSARPGYRLSYMNAVQLLNIYAPYFARPKDERNTALAGQPIWSGHFRDGQPSFLAYHWLMRMDGSFERLLDDDQIGWHAGNWDINKRSVAICLDNDYESQDPSDEVLRQLAAHIKKHYPAIKKIIGHREARSGTICPGTNFLTDWKPKLLKYLDDQP